MSANVRDYGAIGDGMTDDNDAFNRAFSVSPVVTVEPGEYLISGAIHIPAGGRLIGETQDRTIIKRMPTEQTNDQMIHVGPNAQLEYVTIDGNWPQTNGWVAEMVVQPGGIIDHITWRNGSNGIGQLDSDCQVLHSKFYGAGKPDEGAYWGWWFGQGGLRNITIERSTFEGIRLNALYGGADNMRVLFCDFKNNHCQIEPTGGGHIDLINDCCGTLIEGNHFGESGPGSTALEIDSVDGIQIRGNNIEKMGNAGIVLQTKNVHNAVIDSNIVRDCKGAALWMDWVDNLIWVNNRFHNNRGLRINAGRLQDRNNAVT